jgi:integrase
VQTEAENLAWGVLPKTATTRDGDQWSPSDEIWKFYGLSGRIYISFRSVRSCATTELIRSARLVIMHYIQTASISSVHNYYVCLISLLKHVGSQTPISIIAPYDIISYKSTVDRRTEWRLCCLRSLFKTWVELGLPGVDPAVVSLLKEMRFRGTVTGEAVRTADPKKGPFTDNEFQAIISVLNNGFARGEVDTEDYILVWLLLALGARPAQLAAIKHSDFSANHASDGATAYILRVPRAKQRNQAPRSEFKPRKLIQEIGEVIESYCDVMQRRWSHLGLPKESLPLFVNQRNSKTSTNMIYHCSSANLGLRVKAVFRSLQVVSERTGKPMLIIPRRFRYTRGTRAAAEGASELVIAEILDHSNILNVGVYVEAIPEIVERIDRALAFHLAPLAQAFAGTLVLDESKATRAGDPRSRIVTPMDLQRPVGNCGSYGFCGAAAPFACYTCRNFQPWRDGPHDQVLEQLLADRERTMVETGDAVIAAVNDRLIYACAEVVRLCQIVRSGGSPNQ